MHNSAGQSLESGERDHPVTVGVTAANKPLNRFNNITVCELICACVNTARVLCSLPHYPFSPFYSHLPSLFLLPYFIKCYSDDDNRIVLQPLSGCSDCQKDYINASFVDVCIHSYKIKWMYALHSTQ